MMVSTPGCEKFICVIVQVAPVVFLIFISRVTLLQDIAYCCWGMRSMLISAAKLFAVMMNKDMRTQSKLFLIMRAGVSIKVE